MLDVSLWPDDQKFEDHIIVEHDFEGLQVRRWQLCMHMYVCMYVSMYVCVCVFVCVRVCSIHTDTYCNRACIRGFAGEKMAFMYAYVCICMCVCIYVYMYMIYIYRHVL